MAFSLIGCSQTRQYQPPVDPATLSEIQFVHYLEQVPVATFGEGCRALAIAADGHDAYSDHAARYAALRDRDIVRDAWKLEPEQSLDLGTLAYMTAKVCNLPPTVDTVVFGSWGLGDRRYALRQAVEHRIIGYNSTYHLVTGEELVATLHHVDVYMAARQQYDAGSPLPDTPSDVSAGGSTAASSGPVHGGK
jgi:hypothetical protein